MTAENAALLGRQSIPLMPILALGFFSISTGAVRIAGIPLTVLLSLLVVFIMLIIIRFKLSRLVILIAIGIILAYTPGFILATLHGRIETLSLLNLFSSLFIFISTFSYVKEYLDRADTKSPIKLRRAILTILLFSVFEIFNYDMISTLKEVYYRGVLADHTARDVVLYGLARPTAFFSEPSNLARFLSILLAVYYALSRNSVETFWMSLAALVVVRSPILFYAFPVFLLIYWHGDNYSTVRRSQFSRNVRWLILGLFGIVLSFSLFASQYSRLQSHMNNIDGSLNARIILPIRYLSGAWSQPIFGLGPTPNSEIDAYVNAIHIFEGHRYWLLGQEFSMGLAPSFVLIAGFGVLGLFLLGLFLYTAFGRYGLASLAIMMLSNVMGTGANAPAMYVPTAFLLATSWSLWRQR